MKVTDNQLGLTAYWLVDNFCNGDKDEAGSLLAYLIALRDRKKPFADEVRWAARGQMDPIDGGLCGSQTCHC